MSRLSIRKTILGIVTAGSSYIVGGAVLDAVSNAIAQITLAVTIVGTVLLALSWTAVQVILKTHPIHWQGYNVKRLGYYPSCVFVGIGLLLWTPPILNQFNRSSQPEVSQQTKSEKKEANVVVLVSEFSGIDPQAYGVTQIIFDQLNEVTKGYGDVKLKLLREVIETSDVAEIKGKEAQADIVLWGNYLVNQSQARVTIHFDLINKSVDIPIHGDKEVMTAKTVKLEDFTIQEMLSRKMSYLILLTIGLVRIEALDFDGAMASFTQALSLSATPEEIIEPHHLYSYRGLIYVIKGDYTAAITDFNKALSYKQTATSLIYRGMTYFHQGQLESALHDVEKALSIEADGDTYVMRGLMRVFTNEPDLALADFERALVIDSNNIEAYLDRSVVYIQRRELELAMSDLNRLISLDADFAPAYHNRGIVNALKGDVEKAIADYSVAIEINPQHERAYVSRGSLFLNQGILDKAIEDFNTAEMVTPDYSKVYSLRAQAFATKGDTDKALSDYTKAIHLGSDATYLHYFNRGVLYQQKGDLELALNDYNQSVELNPTYADVYANRCGVYQLKGNLSQAIADCTRAVNLNPQNPKVYYNRGVVLASQKKTTLAISDFDRAIKLEPNYSKAYYNRGVAYYERGENDKAVMDFKKVVELRNDPSIVSTATQTLCKLNAGSC